jgi:Tfp pilus assembly major pilin PilA
MDNLGNPAIEHGSDDSESIYRAPSSDTSFAPQGDLESIFIGPKNARYYLDKFADFRSHGGSVSWNWPAFFIASIWFLYRKMWLNAFLYWIVLPVTLMVLTGVLAASGAGAASGLFYYGSYWFITFIIVPMFANRLYYRHTQRKISKVVAVTSAPEQQSIEVARSGGTSTIALVIVPFILVFVIGIVAAISIPAYNDYSVRAEVSEGLALAGGAKAAVTEHYQDTGEFPENNYAAALERPGDIFGRYVASVSVNDGDVVVTYGKQSNSIIDGKTLVMSPAVDSDSVSWTCYSEKIPAKHLPAACR